MLWLIKSFCIRAGVKCFHIYLEIFDPLLTTTSRTAVMAPQGPGQGQDPSLESPLWNEEAEGPVQKLRKGRTGGDGGRTVEPGGFGGDHNLNHSGWAEMDDASPLDAPPRRQTCFWASYPCTATSCRRSLRCQHRDGLTCLMPINIISWI